MKPWQPKEILRFNYRAIERTRNPRDDFYNTKIILDVQDTALVKLYFVLNQYYTIEIIFDHPIRVFHDGRVTLNLRFENTHLNKEVMKFADLKWNTDTLQKENPEFDHEALSFIMIENHEYDDYLQGQCIGLPVYDFYFYAENITVIATSPFYPKVIVREMDLYTSFVEKYLDGVDVENFTLYTTPYNAEYDKKLHGKNSFK